MKSGKYQVTFTMDLDGYDSVEEATAFIRGVLEDSLDVNQPSEVNLEFVDGTELDYTIEEEQLEELNF